MSASKKKMAAKKPRRRGGGGVPGRDPVERFNSFVEVEDESRPGMTTPCARWTGALNSKGHGCFSFGGKGKVVLAARWAFEHLKGEDIPPGKVVALLCRFNACVNLDHLELRDEAVNKALGMSPTAVNARKTSCKRGHPLVVDNLLKRKDGSRQCRLCQNIRRRGEVGSKGADGGPQP